MKNRSVLLAVAVGVTIGVVMFRESKCDSIKNQVAGIWMFQYQDINAEIKGNLVKLKFDREGHCWCEDKGIWVKDNVTSFRWISETVLELKNFRAAVSVNGNQMVWQELNKPENKMRFFK